MGGIQIFGGGERECFLRNEKQDSTKMWCETTVLTRKQHKDWTELFYIKLVSNLIFHQMSDMEGNLHTDSL